MKSIPEKLSRNRFIALIIAALISIGMGAGVGMTVSIIGNFVYLILLFPIGMGFAAGSFLANLVKELKIRGVVEAAFLSLLAAVTMYGAYHYGRYMALQVQTSMMLFSTFSKAMEDESLHIARTLVDSAMQEQTGYSGFGGYMLYRAQEGVSIGRSYSNNRLNLGFTFTWLYWFIEFGIIQWIILLLARKSAGALYCELCKNWYGSEKHLGGTSLRKESQSAAMISRKDFAGIKTLLETKTEIPGVEFYLQSCETCNNNVSHLTVRHSYRNAKGILYFKDVARYSLSPTDTALLSGTAVPDAHLTAAYAQGARLTFGD